MVRNPNNEASSSKSSKTSDDMGSSTWPNLNPELLSLIMMRLRVVDYVAFSGVCQSWRSLAHSEKNKFMSSKQPMSVSFSFSTKGKKECHLTDLNGNTFTTVLPSSTARTSVGSTCGYLIFFGRKTREFVLVNPITRHELHFPGFPFHVSNDPTSVRGTLVFSPSMSGWVLVISHRFSSVISFSLAGTQPSWDYLSFNFPVLDIHYFKGKIYSLNSENRLCEVKLNAKPQPVLTQLTMKNVPERDLIHPEFVSSGENLYVVSRISKDAYETFKIDFDKMEWVLTGKTIGEYAVFVSDLKSSSAMNPETWMLYDTDKSKNKGRWFTANLWYFRHVCEQANLLQ
ncbi:putative F-box protein [Helianthus annuus]|nr:putative F-box protein [Helianthus annuus]